MCYSLNKSYQYAQVPFIFILQSFYPKWAFECKKEKKISSFEDDNDKTNELIHFLSSFWTYSREEEEHTCRKKGERKEGEMEGSYWPQLDIVCDGGFVKVWLEICSPSSSWANEVKMCNVHTFCTSRSSETKSLRTQMLATKTWNEQMLVGCEDDSRCTHRWTNLMHIIENVHQIKTFQ